MADPQDCVISFTILSKVSVLEDTNRMCWETLKKDTQVTFNSWRGVKSLLVCNNQCLIFSLKGPIY